MSEETGGAPVDPRASIAELRAKGGDAAELADLLEQALDAGLAHCARTDADPSAPIPIIASQAHFDALMERLRAKALRFMNGSKNDV